MSIATWIRIFFRSVFLWSRKRLKNHRHGNDAARIVAKVEESTPAEAGSIGPVPVPTEAPATAAEVPPPPLKGRKDGGWARDRMIASRCWRPTWEETGLLDAFATLGPGREAEALLAALNEGAGPVAFGRSSEAAEEWSAGGDGGNGTPSRESLRHHRAALAWLARHPGDTYAQALLRALRHETDGV